MENRLERKVTYEVNLSAFELGAVQSILAMGSIMDKAYKFPSVETAKAPTKKLAYGTKTSEPALVREPAYA